MKITRIHHVAYRCHDAKQTVEWYAKSLDMAFLLAFFELPSQPPMGRDTNTPDWVQHIAFEVDSLDVLETVKARLQADGSEVVGITDHTLFKSIYFFDPNGHRLELAVDTSTPELSARAAAVKWDMLNEWSQTKRAPKHAAWMHASEFQAWATCPPPPCLP